VANSQSDYENFIIRIELDSRDLEAGAERAANKIAGLNGSLDSLNPNLTRAANAFAALAGTQAKQAQQAGAQKSAIQSLNVQLYDQAQAYQRVAAAEKIVADRTRALQVAEETRLRTLSTTRYALYDVSNTLGLVGAGMIALAAATYGAGIAFERDFANVIRTAGPAIRENASAIDVLRKNFIALGQDIPVSFEKLAEIASLGGQLGISADQLTIFTSVVARFSATTNLSVDQAATAFGRLKALLPDISSGQYTLEALASSILKVGTNSVATEAEITKIAVQISSMAGYAGLGADELVGLAGALASVGTQPELARGTITRLFTLFGKAVSDNGEKLSEFAKVAGVSAAEFRSAFGTDKFGPIFLQFINGLNAIDSSGGDVVKTLNDLGITSVRDVPALTRLATAADSAGRAGQILNETYRDAASGIQEASELSDQYGIIASTVAAKIQVLQNNFNALVSSIAGGGTLFAPFLDALNGFLEILTAIAQNPVGNFLLQLGVVLSAIIGLLALAGAGAARFVAASIAVQQGLLGIAAAGLPASASLRSVAIQLEGTGAAGKVAAAGLTVARLGLIAMIAAASAGVQIELFKAITLGANSLADALFQTSDATHDIADRLTKLGLFKSTGFDSFLGGLSKELANIGLTSDASARDLKTLDDRFAALVQSGNVQAVNKLIKQLATDNGISVDQLLTKFPELSKQLLIVGEASGSTASAVEVLNEATDEAAEYQEAMAAALGLTSDAFKEYTEALASNFSQLTNLGTILSTVQGNAREFAEAQAAATDDSKDSWEDFYDGVSISLKAYNDELEASIAATASWQANLLALVAAGADPNEIAQLIALGPEKGAVLVQAAVDDIGGEGLRLIDLLKQTGADAATGFAGEFTANQSLIQAAFDQAGIEAATALKDALVNGSTADVQAIIAKYNLDLSNNPLQIQANTAPAINAVNSALTRIASAVVTIGVDATPKTNSYRAGTVNKYAAAGGYIRGPGSGTSDSIPARLSNGEYVIRAASVRRYGTGLFEQLNRGVAKFAAGGQVGRGSYASAGGGAGMMYLDPGTTALLRELAKIGDRPIYVTVGDETISRAAQRGDSARRSRGETRA